MTLEEIKKDIVDDIIKSHRTCRCQYRTCILPDPLALPEVTEGYEVVKAKTGRVNDSDIRKLKEECEQWNQAHSEHKRTVIWTAAQMHECDTVRGEYGAPYVFEVRYNALVIEKK